MSVTSTSSPRLPSPPPPTEIQIGPKSPSLRGSSSNAESTIEQSLLDANASRRIHPGTKSADMAAGPPLIPLAELDSAFQLQEHLKALHYYYTKPLTSEHTIAISRETALIIANPPEGLDQTLWLYELCRFLINKCNDLIIGFLFDDPPCSASTCPEMRASEWQFLCAVHESPKSCCAIDYCCHTLDWATNIVTSQKIFPSRLSLQAGDAVDDRGAGVKHLVNIFRRLHRIFAHAWFQHRGVFWQVEGQTGLYVLFKTVCDVHDLLPPENYKLPPEAEGLENPEDVRPVAPTIAKSGSLGLMGPDEDIINIGRNNTRRHIRQSPSVGSAVTTVLEADEEDADVTQRLVDLHVTEEESGSEIPVIVETYEVDELHETEPIVEKAELESTGPIVERKEERHEPTAEDLKSLGISPEDHSEDWPKAREDDVETDTETTIEDPHPESESEDKIPQKKTEATTANIEPEPKVDFEAAPEKSPQIDEDINAKAKDASQEPQTQEGLSAEEVETVASETEKEEVGKEDNA